MDRRSLWGVALSLWAAPGLAQAPMKPPAKPLVIDAKLPKATQSAQLQLRADELLTAGKPEEAAPLFLKAAELTPDDWTLWDRAGWTYLDAAQPAPALKAFTSARQAAPPGTPAVGGLLISHFALGNKEEVLRLVKEAAPSELAAAAATVATQGLAAKPRTLNWNYALAYLYGRVLRNSARGLAPAEAVIKENPKHADAWLLLVEMNQDLNQGPQEDAAALQYLELAPETADAYRLRARRYAVLRKDEEAVQEYLAGIAKHPLSGDLYFQLARVYERQGQPKEAEAVYQKLSKAAADRKRSDLQAQARAQLANFQARRGDYAAAETYYREAVRRPEAVGATWTTWGSLLALQGKWEPAAKAWEEAVEREAKARGTTHPAVREDLLAARYRAAVCRLAAAQQDKALAGLSAALAYRGETRTILSMEVALFQAWVSGAAGSETLAYQRGDERWAGFTWRREPEEGEIGLRGRFSPAATAWRAILQQVQKQYPDCWPADYALARIYASAGFSAEALALLSRAAGGQANWWAPHYAQGQYYARQGDKEKGVPVLTRVVELAPDLRQARTYLTLLRMKKDAAEPETE